MTPLRANHNIATWLVPKIITKRCLSTRCLPGPLYLKGCTVNEHETALSVTLGISHPADHYVTVCETVRRVKEAGVRLLDYLKRVENSRFLRLDYLIEQNFGGQNCRKSSLLPKILSDKVCRLQFFRKYPPGQNQKFGAVPSRGHILRCSSHQQRRYTTYLPLLSFSILNWILQCTFGYWHIPLPYPPPYSPVFTKIFKYKKQSYLIQLVVGRPK